MKNIQYIILVLLLLVFKQNSAQSAYLGFERIWAESREDIYYVHSRTLNADLYYGKSIEEIQWSKSVFIEAGQRVEFPIKSPERVYFAAVSGKDTLYFSDRRLAVKNSGNFRDLGGMPTRDGRYIAWNKLFRSGDIGRLNHDDLEYLRKLDVGHVIDFRTNDEIKKSTDRLPENHSVQWHSCEIGRSSDKDMLQVFYRIFSKPDVSGEEVDEIFKGFYKNMAGMLPDFKPAFQVILEQNKPILYHCSAGKDRTGVMTALLLYALGVEEHTIVEDFYLSNKYSRESKVAGENDFFKHLNPEVKDILMGVHPKYITAFFDTCKKRYGSVEKAMEQELGIGREEREKLKRQYTTL